MAQVYSNTTLFNIILMDISKAERVTENPHHITSRLASSSKLRHALPQPQPRP